MEDRLARLEEEVQALRASLEQIQGRLGLLESGAVQAAPSAEPAPQLEVPDLTSAGRLAFLSSGGAIFGRFCLVLGGGYLLRALTEVGTLPALLGVVLGVLYAATWLVLADRAGRSHALSPVFHGLAAAIIGFPLVVEGTLRFEVLSPWVGALLVGALGLAGLAVAARRGLPWLAWITTVFAMVATTYLLFRTHVPAPHLALALIFAAATLGVSHFKTTWALRGLGAASVDLLGVLLLVVAIKGDQEWLATGGVVAFLLALVVLYLGWQAIAVVRLGREVGAFGVIQSVAVLVIGLEGALWLVGPGFATGLGVLCLLAGAAAYGAAMGPLAAREKLWSGWAVGLVGAFLVAEALRLVAPAGMASLGVGVAAVVAAVLSSRWERSGFAAHAALFGAAALIASGHAATTVAALTTSAQGSWDHPWPLGAVAVALALSAWGVLAARLDDALLPRILVPRATLFAVGLLGTGGLAVLLLAPPLAGVPGEAADAGVLAVVRTFVLCALAFVIALARRWRALPELTWGAYALLAFSAVKLLLEDLVQGRPATLVLSMLFFGGALAGISWLLRGLHVFSLEVEEVR